MKDFLDTLGDEEVAEIAAAMKEVREEGLRSARHLQANIYEVRSEGPRATYRILFAPLGKRSQVLLVLVGFKKKTQKTPPRMIQLARRRLGDWERRGPSISRVVSQ